MHGVISNALTLKTRPFSTFDDFGEKIMHTRRKKFHCATMELTQYDKFMMEKQLELETMTVALTSDVELRDALLNDCQGQCGPFAFKRKTTRE